MLDKFQNDSQQLSLQNAAWSAFEAEKLAMDDFLGGALTEEMYSDAMATTTAAVDRAVSGGVSRKDLPIA